MRKIKCFLGLHNWFYYFHVLVRRECDSCKKKEMYAHMSYTVGWKWIKDK